MGGGLNALVRYGKHEELIEIFRNINNIIDCINIIKKEEHFTKYYRYNMLAIFYWENKIHQCYEELYNTINHILLTANIYVTFTDEKRKKDFNYCGINWEDGKSQFFCSKCNKKIQYATLIKNIKKHDNFGCESCCSKFYKIPKINIDLNIGLNL